MAKEMTPGQVIENLIRRFVDRNYNGLYDHPRIARIISGSGNEYTIKLLDSSGNDDDDFKEIPHVPSNSGYQSGDKAVVIFLYRNLGMPYLVGKYGG